MRLLLKGLGTFGKAILITTGVAFGLVRGLRVLDASIENNAEFGLIKARIDALDLAVARLGQQTNEQAKEVRSRMDNIVTREELSQALDRAFGRLETDVDAKFDRQTRAVEALRLMVGQTDELLQKVLDGLESIRNDEDLAETTR